MGRPSLSSDCDDLGLFVHKRNVIRSRNLLDALRAHHGGCDDEVIEVIEVAPETDPVPAFQGIEQPPILIFTNKIEQIKRIVCKHFGVSKSSIESSSRGKAIVYPRHICMYLARKHTTHSYPEIGRRFGRRDHTTILHAFNKIDGLIQQDNKTSAEVALLEASMS